jgi:hypothetical protein
MKFVLFLIFHAFLGSVVFGQAPPPPPPAPANDYFPDKWSEHSFPEYGFAARFPRAPKQTIDAATLNTDEVDRVTFAINNPRFLSYAVTVSILKSAPANADAEKNVTARWQAAQLAAAGPEARSLNSKPISLKDIAAEYLEVAAAGKRIRGLAFVRGRAVFTILFVAPGDARGMKSQDGYREIAEAFLTSFRFLDENEMAKAAVGIDDSLGKDWKEFRSDDDGFTIQFPAQPQKKTSDVDVGVGKIAQTEYSVRGQRLLYSAVVQNYGINVTDPKVKENLFGQWRRGFEERAGTTAVNVETIPFQNGTGRMLRLETPAAVLVTRAFLGNGRFYSISVGYDRGLESMRDEKKVADEAANRFFGSFATIVPKDLRDLMASDQGLPDGFFGEHIGNKYQNAHLGLALDLPAAWVFSPSEDMKMLAKVGRDRLASDNPALLKRVNSKEKALFMLSKHPLGTESNPSLAVGVTILSTSNIDLVGTIRNSERTFASLEGSAITVPTATYRAGNRNFAYFEREIKHGSFAYKQRVVGTLVRNYVVFFVLTYMDDVDKQPLLDTLRTLSFR